MIDQYPKVKGCCPMGCGETLFLGSGGFVTCSWCDCPEPDAAATLLRAADKVVEAVEALRDLDVTDPSHRYRHNPAWAHGRAHLRAERALEAISGDVRGPERARALLEESRRARVDVREGAAEWTAL